MTFHDDNFGHWDGMDDPDMQQFFQEVQRKSVRKKCLGCGRMVKIMPHYAYCDTCATRREQGVDL